jgi:hypothetical protein
MNRQEYASLFDKRVDKIKECLLLEFKLFKELRLCLKKDDINKLIADHIRIVRTFEVKQICEEVSRLSDIFRANLQTKMGFLLFLKDFLEFISNL